MNRLGTGVDFSSSQRRVDVLVRSQAHIGRRNTCFLQREAGVHAALSGIDIREYADTFPGKMAESDWSPYTIRFTTGITAVIQALSYVLVSSKRKFFELYESNDLHALMDGHDLAFARFGACAHECKYDSQKPVVLRWECNQPIYNPRFLAFSTHYEFRPVAVRRGHPNDKPRTERSF